MTVENVQGFCGAASPCRDFGRPFGNLKDARDQNQRIPEPEQTLTGWLNVTTAATSDTTPAAQLGLQSSSLYVPVPTASVPDQADHFILARNAVESPDSGQPKLEVQAGSYSGVALMSWLGARKVPVPGGEAVTLGEEDEAAADEVGALGDPVKVGDPADVGDPPDVLAALVAVEVADELQAVTSKATQASPAQNSTALPGACRYLRDFVININSHPLTSQSGSESHVTSTTFAVMPWLETRWATRLNQGPFRINITAGTGCGGQRTERTLVIVTPAAIDASPASAKSDG